MRVHKLILIFCFGFILNHVQSQPIQLSNVRFWGGNEGLLNRNVRALAADKEGFIWLGTMTGLVRFDGRNFVSLKQIIKSHPLGFDPINDLAVLGNTLWITTNNGLYKLNTNTYSIEKMCLPKGANKCLSAIKTDQLILLKNNRLLVDGSEEGIWVIDTLGRFKEIKNPLNKSFTKTKSYAIDLKQNVWFSNTANEIYCLDANTLNITFAKAHKFEINGIYYTTRYGLTVRGYDEVYLYEPQTDKFTSTQNGLFKMANMLLAEEVKGTWLTRNRHELWFLHNNESYNLSYIFDKIEEANFIIIAIKRIKDQLWVCTNYGLLKADVSEQLYPHFFSSKNGSKREDNYSVRGMTEADNHDIYFGSYQGLFKIPFPYQPHKIDKIKFDTIEDYIPYCISIDHDFIWIGSEGGGLSKYNLRTKVHKRFPIFNYPYDNKFIIAMLNDRQEQRIVLGTYEGLILFDKTKEVFTRVPLAYKNINYNDAKIFQITRVKNEYWICTSKGLIRCNYSFKILEQFDLKQRQVACMYYDQLNDLIWAGTTGEGLFCITPNRKIINYSFKEGLPDDNIVSIIPQKNKLYIGTYFGLSLFNPVEKTFSNIHTQQGISHNEFNHGAYFKNSFGNLFIGGVNGYNLILQHPVNPDDENQVNAPFISSIYILNKEQETSIYNCKSTPSVFIPNSNKVLEFEFGLSDYNQPEKCVFAYKLDGIDNDWVYLGNRNNFRLTELNAGTYKLRVKAAGSNGNWSMMPNVLTITVDQKFYLKWWFILLEVMVVSFAVITFYRIRINQLKRMLSLRLQISSDLHDEVGSILTAVGMQAELLQNKNIDKQDELNQIAETSRKAVSNMRDVVWSIDARNDLAKDLIDRMHEYLSELFDASPISFTFTKDVQNPNQSIDLFTRQNTYLIFKESLNNIAKHANATHVNIELVINASALKLAISNNGQSQTNPKPGMGLRNMEMRAKKMKAELTIDPENCYKLILLKKL